MKIDPNISSQPGGMAKGQGVKNAGVMFNVTEKFDKSLPDEQALTEKGMKEALMEQNVSNLLNKSVAQGVTETIKLSDTPAYTYYDSKGIGRIDDGKTAAIKVAGPHMDSPHSIVFFSPSMKQTKEVPTTACQLYSSPDGSFVAVGRITYHDDTLVTAYTADGEEKWQVNLSKEKPSPFIQSVNVNADGDVLVVHSDKTASAIRGGKLSQISGGGDAHDMIFDELGNVYDCDFYTNTPSYVRHDPSGKKQKVSLPQIPGVTRLDYSGEGPSPRRIDDPMALTDGSVIVTANPLKDGYLKSYLLIPGKKKAVELSVKGYLIVREFVQGPDGTIYTVALRQGQDQNAKPGEGPAERALAAFNPDGSLKWQVPISASEIGAGREKLFMDSKNHVFVFTNYLYDKNEGGEKSSSGVQAFDSRGNKMWWKNFDDHQDLEKAEANTDGSVNVYFQSSADIFHISPFDAQSVKGIKDQAIKDLGCKGRETASEPVIEVDPDEGMVNVGGVKLPVNRRFMWIHS